MEPLDPPSWDEMLDNLGYATDNEEDADLYYVRKASKDKSKVKPKVKEYDWDDYN
jgi:hypothetical protein